MALVVGLDGDDTLWHNERVFSMIEERFEALLAPWAPGDEVAARLLEVERRNLDVLGYGVKSFTLSMIETAIEVSGGEAPNPVITSILDLGRQMLAYPVELFDGVEETLARLAQRWRLVLITKGDLFHQESKVARSGLLPYVDHVEIVSDKDVSVYRKLLDKLGVTPADFVMVGDSVRSDIAPAMALGAQAVHIPGYREWELERAPLPEGCHRLESITELPALLSTLDAAPGKKD
jgi:putative hydrolase of the HAD superfamily